MVPAREKGVGGTAECRKQKAECGKLEELGRCAYELRSLRRAALVPSATMPAGFALFDWLGACLPNWPIHSKTLQYQQFSNAAFSSPPPTIMSL